MAPRGLALLIAQHHRWKGKRGIPRPQRSVSRQHAHGEMFPPLAQEFAGGVQAGPLFDGRSLDISPLGAKLSRAFPGAEGLVHPPRSLRSPRRR